MSDDIPESTAPLPAASPGGAIHDARSGMGTPAVKTPEELTPQEKELVESYSRAAGARGVLVGAIVGQADWDVRPMRVEGGIVTVLRLENPAASHDPMGGQRFGEVANRLNALKQLAGLRAYGREGERWWLKRRFYPQLLSSPEAVAQLSNRRDIFLLIVDSIECLHRADLQHGHLVPANVAVLDGDPVLLDIGWWLIQGLSQVDDRSSFAPEVQAGFALSPAADFFGLGLIGKVLLPDAGDREQELFQQLLSREPSRRPDLGAIRQVMLGLATRPLVRTLPQGAVVRPMPVEAPAAPVAVPPAATPPPPSSPVLLTKAPGQSNGDTTAAKSLWLWGVMAILFVLVGMKLWSMFVVAGPYGDWWMSGDPASQRRVIEAAVLQQDSHAQSVIVEAFRSGTAFPPAINSNILALGLRPEWEQSLGSRDLTLLLGVAALPLLGNKTPPFPTFTTVHPGVVLALAANLGLDQRLPEFDSYPVSALAKLPGTFGIAFELLGTLRLRPAETGGELVLGDPLARIAARFFGGDVSAGTVRTFFSSALEGPTQLKSNEVVLRAATILRSALAIHPGRSGEVYEYLLRSPYARPLNLDWFSAGTGMDLEQSWSKTPAFVKLSLVVGEVPDSFEQDLLLFDALSFPNHETRLQVARKAAIFFLDTPDKAAVQVLAEGDHSLTREQVVLLLSALRLPKDSQQTEFVSGLLSDWFQTAPDPQTVLTVLLARKDAPSTDLWNLFASRYLRTSEWEGDLETLTALASHPEPLARALAYQRLRMTVPEERALIEARAKVEGNAKLRSKLQERLSDLAENDALGALPDAVDDEWLSVVDEDVAAGRKP